MWSPGISRLISTGISFLELLGLSPPLTDALAGSPTVLPWSKELQTAYDKAKSTLVSTVLLSHPSPSIEVSLVTYASANIQKINLLLFSKLAEV